MYAGGLSAWLGHSQGVGAWVLGLGKDLRLKYFD